jgi:predicted aldo/keto reductase-like oxidoreductase
MKHKSSRRTFLAAGLAVPAAVASTSRQPRTVEPAPAPLGASDLRYRVLGKTGLKVTSVGFGCMITSDASVIEKAADLGINYFDTARGYQRGNNERMVGAALKSKRSQIVLSSKSGAPTKQAALDLETSLKELGTDYLDIWYLHAKSKASDLTDEWLEVQAQAKKEGKIRFSGVSTHGGQPEIIPAIIAKLPQIDVILTSYNFTMDSSMEGLIASAEKAGLGIVAMKVMAGGFRRAKEGDRTYEIFKREGAMFSALKWVLRNSHVHTTVPSITDMEQLDEDMRAMTSPYTEADGKLLAEQLERIRPLYCRMCGQCIGACPRGLPIPDMVRFLSYAEGYGQFALGRESFMELPEEVRSIRCNDCETCAVHCPNGINVAGRLARAQEVFA